MDPEYKAHIQSEQEPIDPTKETKEYTYADVAAHDSKHDLWMVVHDKVYNVGNFVDEHPGGEEVMMDVGGQDATESFEDVGHSDEAREILAGFLVGDLKRLATDPLPSVASASKVATDTSVGGIPVFVYALLAMLVAGGAYLYLQASK